MHGWMANRLGLNLRTCCIPSPQHTMYLVASSGVVANQVLELTVRLL